MKTRKKRTETKAREREGRDDTPSEDNGPRKKIQGKVPSHSVSGESEGLGMKTRGRKIEAEPERDERSRKEGNWTQRERGRTKQRPK